MLSKDSAKCSFDNTRSVRLDEVQTKFVPRASLISSVTNGAKKQTRMNFTFILVVLSICSIKSADARLAIIWKTGV